MGPRPPRLAVRLLERLSPEERREFLVGDLHELFARRAHRQPAVLARLRFWIDALRTVAEARRGGSSGGTGQARRLQHLATGSSGVTIMDRLRTDLRLALRLVRVRPLLSAVVVLTVALGVGANTVLFSVVRAVVLRPLPYPDPAGLVMIWETTPWSQGRPDSVAPANFLDWQGAAARLSSMAALAPAEFNLSGAGEPERIPAARVSWTFLPTLGLRPLAGRWFEAAEDRPAAEAVVVVGHGLWLRRFGGDPGVVGRTLTLDGRSHRVIGIAPPVLSHPTADAELWVPLALTDDQRRQRRAHFLQVVGRLAPDVSLEDAQSEMDVVAARLSADHPNPAGATGVRLTRLHDEVVGSSRPLMWMLLGIVALIMAIACGNIATLFLAQARRREKEMAIRTALGAGWSTLVRQLLVESTVIAALGGTAGVAGAFLSLGLVSAFGALGVPRLDEVDIDAVVLAFSAGLTLLVAVIFGLVPAWQALRARPRDALSEGGRQTTAFRPRAQRALVIGQTAVALLLLVGAGLLLNSFVRLRSIDPGFRTEQALTLRVALASERYRDVESRGRFFTELLDRVGEVGGVEAAAVVSFLPLTYPGGTVGLAIQDRPRPEPDAPRGAAVRVVSPQFFSTLGVPIRRGRAFLPSDVTFGEHVAVIDESLARRDWPDRDPVGAYVRMQAGAGRDAPWLRIVGVVGEVRQVALAEAPRPALYIPYSAPHEPWLAPQDLIVRTARDPLQFVAPIASILRDVDPLTPISDVATLDAVVAGSIASQRVMAQLVGVFGALALLLAALGIYGLLAYVVAQRTQELGVRLALGAAPGDVFRLVFREGVMLTTLGLAIGLIAAFGATRLLQGLLFDVTPTDPATYGGISAILLLVAALASAVPAYRATRVDPLETLRLE